MTAQGISDAFIDARLVADAVTRWLSGEGTFDEYPPPMVETGSKNYLKISLEEIAAGKIKYRYR